MCVCVCVCVVMGFSGCVVQDEVRQVRQQARTATAELLEPGIDVLVAKLHDAETQNANLQQQLRHAAGATSSAGESDGVKHLKVEVEHLKAVNGNLRAENRTLKSDVKVCPGRVFACGATSDRCMDVYRQDLSSGPFLS